MRCRCPAPLLCSIWWLWTSDDLWAGSWSLKLRLKLWPSAPRFVPQRWWSCLLDPVLGVKMLVPWACFWFLKQGLALNPQTTHLPWVLERMGPSLVVNLNQDPFLLISVTHVELAHVLEWLALPFGGPCDLVIWKLYKPCKTLLTHPGSVCTTLEKVSGKITSSTQPCKITWYF